MRDYELFNEDFLLGVNKIKDESIDLVIADPPYGLNKDYGNDSDNVSSEELLEWTRLWISSIIPKMKPSASLYIFASWKNSPEIFSMIKKRMIMINEIIWDRKVPSMGGSTRRYSSVHDTIGFFAKDKRYFFDIDSVRIPYDEKTKKARTRSIFAGKKWLELGCNPKDVWSVSRLHKIHRERENHPTQKPIEIIERMIMASCPEGGVVLDPFAGSGTTVAASVLHHRRCIAFEINPDYCKIIHKRIAHLTERLI
ncbi:MAG: site-specific DNA-methyltransferase [Rhodobacteraceae bacterium]|nr:site-specific DNA-methyltransferase [Paracoccaceae bacterium]